MISHTLAFFHLIIHCGAFFFFSTVALRCRLSGAALGAAAVQEGRCSAASVRDRVLIVALRTCVPFLTSKPNILTPKC